MIDGTDGGWSFIRGNLADRLSTNIDARTDPHPRLRRLVAEDAASVVLTTAIDDDHDYERHDRAWNLLSTSLWPMSSRVTTQTIIWPGTLNESTTRQQFANILHRYILADESLDPLAARGIARLPPQFTMPPLAAKLTDDGVREIAVVALTPWRQRGGTNVDVLRAANARDVVWHTGDRVVITTPDARQWLTDTTQLGYRDVRWGAAVSVVANIANLDDDLYHDVLAQATSSLPAARLRSVSVLVKMTNQPWFGTGPSLPALPADAKRVLFQALRDPHPDVACAAAHYFQGRVSSDVWKPILVETLEATTDGFQTADLTVWRESVAGAFLSEWHAGRASPEHTKRLARLKERLEAEAEANDSSD
ncbi:MAG: hypothetical protein AAF747_10255 [Planctomycetota bacterium]